MNYIYESWPLKNSIGLKDISTWTDLSEFKEYPETIVSNKSSLLYFLGRLPRFRKSPMFIDKKKPVPILVMKLKKLKRVKSL